MVNEPNIIQQQPDVINESFNNLWTRTGLGVSRHNLRGLDVVKLIELEGTKEPMTETI